MKQRKSPRPKRGKLNVVGPRLALLRESAGYTQSSFAAVLQRSGWDIDRVVWLRIESQQRMVTDFEIELILKALKKTWADLG